MNKYPVVFACDENYAMPFAVAVESLLSSAKDDTFYDVFCLVPEVFSEETMGRLNKINEKYDNCNITYLNLSGEFADVKMRIKHISFVTYYRFKIAEKLPQYEKALYLDVDMIIKEDLTELFETDLTDCYIGAVKHPTLLHKTEVKGYKIPEDSYFNAGMLLMNLDLIRKDKKDLEFIELISEQFSIQDQDILNVACGDKVKHLPLKYNTMIRLCKFSEKDNAKKIYKDSFKKAMKNPSIIHYADKTKPWSYKNIYFNKDWDVCFLNSCYSGTIDMSKRKEVCYNKIFIKNMIMLTKRFLIKFKLVRSLHNIKMRYVNHG